MENNRKMDHTIITNIAAPPTASQTLSNMDRFSAGGAVGTAGRMHVVNGSQ